MSSTTEQAKRSKMSYYHYGLNFKNNITFNTPEPDDVGYIIAGSLNHLKLYGAGFFTNAKFISVDTAKEYLSITYTPRFRYLPELNGQIPSHIVDENQKIILSQRTCPAFGKHGGVGEWIIPYKKGNKDIPLEIDNYYPEGGKTERWFMAGWDRELLVVSNILSAYSGCSITPDLLRSVFAINTNENNKDGKINLERDRELESFWSEDRNSVLIAKPSGVVTYYPIGVNINGGYQLLAYLSVSCGYQIMPEGIYIKLWGALWEDYLKLPVGDDKTLCDNEIKAITINSTNNCLFWYHLEIIKKFTAAIENYDACGIRYCYYPFESSDIFFLKDLEDKQTSEKLIKTIASMVISFKNNLINKYKECFHCYCNEPKTLVLLPKIGMEVNV